MKKNTLTALLLVSFASVFAQESTFKVIQNKGGKAIAYAPTSGVKILTLNGLSFKDLNKNGKLDKYEDWRLADDIRAKDLASKLTVEQIAGLMLYSSHQSIPARPGGYFAGTYGGNLSKQVKQTQVI